MNGNDEQSNVFLNVMMALATGALLGVLSVTPFQALGLSGAVGTILRSAVSVVLLGALNVGRVTSLTLDLGAHCRDSFLSGPAVAQNPRGSTQHSKGLRGQTPRVYTVEHKSPLKRLVYSSRAVKQAACV